MVARRSDGDQRTMVIFAIAPRDRVIFRQTRQMFKCSRYCLSAYDTRVCTSTWMRNRLRLKFNFQGIARISRAYSKSLSILYSGDIFFQVFSDYLIVKNNFIFNVSPVDWRAVSFTRESYEESWRALRRNILRLSYFSAIDAYRFENDIIYTNNYLHR